MKKLNTLKFVVLFLCSAMVLPAKAAFFPASTIGVTTKMEDPNPRVQEIINRLQEIKTLDKSNMTRSEKVSMRKEVRHLKKEMKTNLNRGVYLSVGAIIIIVLLLIILL